MGVVTDVGSEVHDFKVGQHVGVGCLANSCQSCESCKEGLEQYCSKLIWTYNSVDKDGTTTQGGFSGELVCDRK